MGTGKFDKNGIEIQVGDIVHFRCKNHSLSGKGIVYEDNSNSDKLGNDPFRIKDTRDNRNKGRIYPWYDDGVYKIEKE